MPGETGLTVVTMLVCLFFTHEASGASSAGIPCALCYQRRERLLQNLGRREIAESYFEFGVPALRGAKRRSNPEAVIPGRCGASNPESRNSPMRNCASEVWCWRTIPEKRVLDCFAGRVIGRAFARPVGSQSRFKNHFGCLKLNPALAWNVNKSREEGDLLGLAHAPDRCQRIGHRGMGSSHDPARDQGRAKGNFERRLVGRLDLWRLRREYRLGLLSGDSEPAGRGSCT
jgi:hypothetical protein